MLSLAVSAGKLSRKPRFSLLEEHNVRQGFLEHGDFLALLGRLPTHLKPLVEFLYLSGWRKGEGARLEWRDVDLNGRIVRLRIEKLQEQGSTGSATRTVGCLKSWKRGNETGASIVPMSFIGGANRSRNFGRRGRRHAWRQGWVRLTKLRGRRRRDTAEPSSTTSGAARREICRGRAYLRLSRWRSPDTRLGACIAAIGL